MPGKPRVGLDRERIATAERFLPALDRRREAVAVPLVGEVALELRDEQPAVCEDEDAECARCFDEARRGDRLSRRGRMTEPVAAYRARIGAGVLLVLLGREFFVDDVLARIFDRLVL